MQASAAADLLNEPLVQQALEQAWNDHSPAIRFGGTCSGEHGVGMHKRDLAAMEHGEAAEVMWAIKEALDPLGIMNPGKLLPTRGDV